MSCDDCDRASREVWGLARFDCKGCSAREVARSPEFFAAKHAVEGEDPRDRVERMRARKVYRELLGSVGLTHAEVLDAWRSDVESQRAVPAGPIQLAGSGRSIRHGDSQEEGRGTEEEVGARQEGHRPRLLMSSAGGSR